MEVRKRALSLVHSAPTVPTPNVSDQKISRDALDEMQELLRLVAAGSAPIRLSAVKYTECRAILMESALRPQLPGFVMQCVSIFKFHEFITLYDARPEARLEFLDDAFNDNRTGPKPKRGYDVFNDPEF